MTFDEYFQKNYLHPKFMDTCMNTVTKPLQIFQNKITLKNDVSRKPRSLNADWNNE